MSTGTFTVTSTTGVNVLKLDAGGSLEPSANGSYVATSTGAGTAESAKRPHLRLIK